MRLFGILLVFLTLVAGVAYVYFGAQDYKGRQQLNAAGLRHVLVLRGMPLDGDRFAPDNETPFVAAMGGGQQTSTVGKALLDKHFADMAKAPANAGAKGGPPSGLASTEAVVSQSAEVLRVHGIVKAELGAAPEAAQRVAAVLKRLLLQAETMDERLLFQSLAAPAGADGKPKTAEQYAADAEQLVHLLDRKFYRVAPKLYDSESGALAPAKWGELKKKMDEAAGNPDALAAIKPAAPTDEGDRRDRIAQLLVHLDQDSAWQQRVATVVGLRHYVRAIASQAVRFRLMREQVDQPIMADQAVFQLRNDVLLNETRHSLDRARTVSQERAKLDDAKAAADDAVSRRRTQLRDLGAQLEKVRAEVDQSLVRQSNIERQLYEIQREVALTLDEVYRLEALLVDVERERYGQPPSARP
ncbi:hypothetical protein GobsT_75240 [Gemmata obscuriglobus]|uniref:Uncharacterized protein n=1 Tax=Gemmata obscuriglobus TaxID=114 RepID=A0A2Z3H6N3_9BACT|nr:hypothetical protein [Gemmata obscuriglobus]AWM41428.1 hypothetical protein C1280_33480 [Gemmata obscuriglobus]QEG32666.1 hypothetical protein GobsT_75240 [Gemmata obscuriglobus]VTS12022.1 unnamed protein product [Gemmata obscuriglobus UQM 2246]